MSQRKPKKRRRRVRTKKSKQKTSSYTYRCSQCGSSEHIPKEVVDFFDAMDPGDATVPPRFRCQECHGIMLPHEGRV